MRYNVLLDQTCVKLCDKSYKSADDKIKFLKHGMMFSYEQHWIVDNMPVTWCSDTEGTGRKFKSKILTKSIFYDFIAHKNLQNKEPEKRRK